MLADMLADLTGRLPDDSWLTELRLSEGHIALSGYSSSAAGLVPIVEASPIYQDVRLSAPVTSDSRLNRERFSIEAAITPRSAK
jgi:general secretion pathway protein L